MGYWDEKRKYEKEKQVKTKCPKSPKIEVVWKHSPWHEAPVCSYSGHPNCKKCIKKEDYPDE